jgi:GntP family gluconate:H+ symporter|tara:strand:- start:538 stop:1884 length:1347 start_codon:yes stop_codon:yes gene_type:complete
MITDSSIVAVAGLVAMIALLFLLITRFKWHVFIALLLPILLFGMIPGISRAEFIDAFEQGFGRTIQGIAVVIVLGSILAEALKHTGGVERITSSMIRWVGERRMPLALTLSGFVIGLAIFSDVGYVILNPLVHSAALAAGVNMSVMGTGLVGAMQLTHAMVPPTPGPLAAVALVGADIGKVILFGGLVTLIGSLAGWLYAQVVGPHVESPPSKEFVGQSFIEQGREAELPSTWGAYAPILIPLTLIAGQSIAALMLPDDHLLNRLMLYLGWPVVALGIGILLAYRQTTSEQVEVRVGTWVEEALRTSAMIIMVTGLGGALSQILRNTPAVEAIAETTAAVGLPAIFLPFVLGVVGNMITGSTTVGVITAASVAAPMMDRLGLTPEATMLAGAAGSMIIKYVNSSYFWVCMSLSRMSLKAALVSYGGVTFVNGVAAMAVVYLLWTIGWI